MPYPGNGSVRYSEKFSLPMLNVGDITPHGRVSRVWETTMGSVCTVYVPDTPSIRGCEVVFTWPTRYTVVRRKRADVPMHDVSPPPPPPPAPSVPHLIFSIRAPAPTS